MRSRGLACSLVGLVACASAGVGGGGGDDDGSAAIDAPAPKDSPTIDAADPDAPAPDAGPVDVTLTQTTSASVGSNNSIACGNPDGTTAENSWYRVFRLADANITNGLRVIAVTFGVQESVGMPAVQVKIGTYSGNVQPPPSQLDIGLISPITAVTFNVPNTTSTAPMAVTVPIIANVPPLSQMIVEVFAPNLNGTSKYFYLGGNNAGESKPAYLRAPSGACATPQPRSTSVLGFPMSHLVISVYGTH
ncbi:MAG: hypothetical protein H0T42_24405 [Deltaproteobacteria bacterium]|nr:hypothetical protein [Deltaproteobacteria bacterium]